MKTLFIALALLCVPVQADISTAIDTTTKVYSGAGREQSVGTGTIISIKNGVVYVLSNAHVVENGSVTTEVYREGHRSVTIPCKVIWQKKNDEIDASIITFSLSRLGGYVPPTLPIADHTPTMVGTTLLTNGCARGGEPSLMKCRLIRVEGPYIYFRPPPAQGRSGSFISDKEATKIVGLLFAKTGKENSDTNSEGMAIKCEVLNKYLKGRNSELDYQDYEVPEHTLLPHKIIYETPEHILLQQAYDWTQCPGGVCPGQGVNPRRPSPQRPQKPRPTEPQESEDGSIPFPTFPGEEPQQPQEVVPPLPIPQQPIPQPHKEIGGLEFRPQDYLLALIIVIAVCYGSFFALKYAKRQLELQK